MRPRPTLPAILLEGDEPVALTGPAPEPAAQTAPVPAPVPAPAPDRQAGSGPADLPESYGTGRLMVLPRDPHCLYAHWDAPPEHPPTSLVVRVHTDLPASQPAAEVQLPPETHHSFIEVSGAATRYTAELGSYSASGQWQPMASCGPVQTPPETAAAEGAVQFATLRPAPAAQAKAPEPAPVTPAPPDAGASGPPILSPRTGQPPPWSQCAPEVAAPMPSAAPQPRPGHAVQLRVVPVPDEGMPGLVPRWPEPESGNRAASAQAEVRLQILAETGGEPLTPEQDRALAELIGHVVPDRNSGSAAIPELLRGRRQAAPGPQARAPQAQEHAAPSLQGVSSPMGGPPAGPPSERWGFWFNVNAELVIYGATEPDAEVTIGGRRIRLRADGTFSYRFALPDGRFDLPVKAVSARGETRAADLHFERGTRYEGEVSPHPQDPALRTPAAENVD